MKTDCSFQKCVSKEFTKCRFVGDRMIRVKVNLENLRSLRKIPVKFVSPLTAEQTNQLEEILKHGDKPRPRLRAQAILWSSQAVSIAAIADRCAVARDTVSTWKDPWEQLGPAGLTVQPLRGNPGRLTAAEKELVLNLVKEHPRSIVSIRAA